MACGIDIGKLVTGTGVVGEGVARALLARPGKSERERERERET
mgnify:CR=1 FL=1